MVSQVALNLINLKKISTLSINLFILCYNSYIKNIIENSQIIGIDFDGVILLPALKRNWIKLNCSTKPRTKIYNFIDVIIKYIFQFIRVSPNKTLETIEKLYKLNKQLILITARESHLKKITIKWLENNGYSKYFSKYIFNENYENAWDFKEKIMGIEKIDLLIDDNPCILEKICRVFPNKNFIHFNVMNNPTVQADNIIVVKEWSELN